MRARHIDMLVTANQTNAWVFNLRLIILKVVPALLIQIFYQCLQKIVLYDLSSQQTKKETM